MQGEVQEIDGHKHIPTITHTPLLGLLLRSKLVRERWCWCYKHPNKKVGQGREGGVAASVLTKRVVWRILQTTDSSELTTYPQKKKERKTFSPFLSLSLLIVTFGPRVEEEEGRKGGEEEENKKAFLFLITSTSRRKRRRRR